MLSYASVVDVLKQMGDYLSRSYIDWITLSTTPGLVRAANGLEVQPQGTLSKGEIFDYLVIVGAVDSAVMVDPELEGWIRHQFSRGATVCATASGTWVLANAGLLKGRRCTLHWRDFDSFRETHPDVEIRDETVVFDGRIVTCSGARTASDMIYAVLNHRFGSEAIEKVRQMLFHERLAQPYESQRPLHERLQQMAPDVLRLVREIEDGIDPNESIASICDRENLVRRTVEKRFRQHLGTSPKVYQLENRVYRAANLLKKSAFTITEIADMTGFASTSALHGAFLKRFGMPPTRYRKDASVALPTKAWKP